MDSFMEEVVGFLEDKRDEVRAEAATTVASLTGSVDGVKLLQGNCKLLYPVLLRLLHDTSSTVVSQVYATLVNLSLDETACRELLALGVVQRVMEILRSGDDFGETPAPSLVGPAKLLSNLTLHQSAIDQLLQKGKGPLEGYFVSWIVKAIVCDDEGKREEREYFSCVLTNVSQDAVGRRALLDSGGANLRVLNDEIDLGKTQTALRRESLCKVYRNVFMGCAKDNTTKDLEETGAIAACVRLLSSIAESPAATSSGTIPLNPAAAPAPAEALTAPCRRAILEGILCLAEEEDTRRELWKQRVPDILQKVYEAEPDISEINEVIERCADIFISNTETEEAQEDQVGKVEEVAG